MLVFDNSGVVGQVLLRKSGFVELKWTMGTGLVVQNNAPLTSSSELIAYRFFDEVESNKIG